MGAEEEHTDMAYALSVKEPSEESFMDQLFDFANETKNDGAINSRRSLCPRCRRPLRVCWCPYLPHERLEIKTSVYILQHPFEESRCLKTAPMLCNGLKEGTCHVYKGKRFPKHKFPELMRVLQAPNTLVLYPGPDAIDISDVPTDIAYNLVLLDGTWAQAKGLYCQNHVIQLPKKVQINHQEKSKYVIRTQPTDGALSTLESGAVAISVLENRPEIVEPLTRPLVALCDFQIQHGAVQHQSREFKIENGLWSKELPKSVKKRLEKRKQEKETYS
ncbi:tRNA-uridine aminocarboxypropyltransferase 2-like [Haliotis cracherodii]|uniref:tRNA-uridine aminocarboxypropyltransferase 2-like n=1 Tax=Haliotis cracherodii TaxID=6455 RepID=UPI0039ECAE45